MTLATEKQHWILGDSVPMEEMTGCGWGQVGGGEGTKMSKAGTTFSFSSSSPSTMYLLNVE